jgi:drug/metabolite transporter (DMT)-like permease
MKTGENMGSNLIGMTAGVVTSCLWTFGALLLASAGKRIGSFSVNAYRTIIAVGFLAVSHFVLLGVLLPVAASAQWFWIGMSGIVGLGIGDFAVLRAFVIIGPRRSLLVYTLSAVFASVGAYLMLGETVQPFGLVGMAITLTGIIVVILEKQESGEQDAVSKKLKTWGFFLALVGAVCQGIGVVLAKKGMYLDSNTTLNPLSATLIRMLFGTLFIWMCAPIAGKLSVLRQALKNKKGIKHATAAAFVAPFLGVTLSMVAVAYTQAGIAQTLISLMPVLIIPVWVFYKQRTSLQGILAAIVAVIGVAVLFLT